MSGIDQDGISSIINNLKTTSKDSKELISEIKRSNIPATMKNLGDTTKHFEQISRQIHQGPGTIHSLIYDRALYDDLASLLDGSKRNKVLKYFIRETIRKSEKPVAETSN